MKDGWEQLSNWHLNSTNLCHCCNNAVPRSVHSIWVKQDVLCGTSLSIDRRVPFLPTPSSFHIVIWEYLWKNTYMFFKYMLSWNDVYTCIPDFKMLKGLFIYYKLFICIINYFIVGCFIINYIFHSYLFVIIYISKYVEKSILGAFKKV